MINFLFLYNFSGLIFATKPFGYAFGIIFLKKASKYYSSKEILFSQMFFSTIIILPFILYMRPTITYLDIFPLIILGVVHQGITFLLFINALKKISSLKVSIITYVEPVMAILLAFIILFEIPSYMNIIGGVLILISSYLTIKK